uniref:uncharacterized protein LOC105352543 n=1 Tax=Fragaria vesca subsp. vesca TaxID=101020 RepID=UPI0005C9694D|nr:PREDICTED: uncharacterized protein LOC105352543 [Fragaria vesca subsp. vesca]
MGHHDSPSPPLAPRKHHSPDSASSDGAATAISRAKKSRYPVDDDGDGDRMECSGKYCRSCSAGMIADCVALCCCPCALFNLLTLALVKVPWMVGRRCLGLGKKNNKKKLRESQGQNRKSKQKCKSKKKMKHCSGGGSSSQRQRRCAAEEELPAQISGYVFGFDDREEEEEEEEDCVSSAERVWLELYQVGHLGFGRVSFGGGVVQSVQGKGNMGT